jgi:regulator of replication initiation timing
VKRTASQKSVGELLHEVRRRDEQINVLQREAFHAEDEVRELREKEAALRLQVDGLCTRLDRMGAEMGAANCREIRVRLIAETALNALAAMASALPSSNVHHCVTTLLAVERDGRAQLAKHMDKPIALEAAR